MSSFSDPLVVSSYVTAASGIAVAFVAKMRERVNRQGVDTRRKRRRSVEQLASDYEDALARQAADHDRERGQLIDQIEWFQRQFELKTGRRVNPPRRPDDD